MKYNSQQYEEIPKGMRKLLFFDWPLLCLISAIACFGFLMLYSVANGSFYPWCQPQMERFSIGLVLLFLVALINIKFWKMMSPFAYIFSFLLLLFVHLFGESGMGAQRWIDLKVIRLQPSEIMKVSLVMFLAAYYTWLSPDKASRPLWVLIPTIIISFPSALILVQPDLGTSLIVLFIGGSTMFLAGVSIWYFTIVLPVITLGLGIIITLSRGTTWQLLKDYHFKRIDSLLNPSLDPLGIGYQITQSKIALGSGGLTGKGFMQGTQSQLKFLPEKHTDFIFTTLAEEFGFFGTVAVLIIYSSIIILTTISAATNNDKYGSLLNSGLTITFFSYFGINIAMVIGLVPVVGVPLPLVSYGGSAMLVLMFAFVLIQCSHIHKLRIKHK